MVQNLTIYTSITLIIYGLIMLYIGYRGYKITKNEGMESYTIARGRLGPITLGVAWAATWASAIVFIGIPGWGYVSGLSVLWHSFLFWGGGIIAALILAKNFKRIGHSFGSLSLPEWIGDRYGNKYLTAIFGLLVFFNILYVAAQFTGLALIFERFLNIPYTIGTIGGLLLVILYVFLGGTYTDVISDSIQGVLMAIIGLSVFLSIFWLFGGISSLESQLASQSPALTNLTNPNFPVFSGAVQIVVIFLAGILIGIQPHLTNKFLSLRTEGDIRKFIGSATIAFFLFYLMLWSGPIARVLNPTLEIPDTATLIVITEAFPTIVAAIFGAALISAVLSTTDGLIVSMGTAIGNDIYRNLITKQEKSLSEERMSEIEQRSVQISRGVVLVVGLIAAGITIARPQFIATLAVIGIFGFVSAATPPLVLGIFWRGGNDWGAFTSAILGPLLFSGYNLGWWLNGIGSNYLAGVIATILSASAMIVVSTITPSSVEENEIRSLFQSDEHSIRSDESD